MTDREIHVPRVGAMTKSASVVALGVVAALAIVWFWFRSNDITTSSPPETPIRESDVPATETPDVIPSAPAVENNVTAPASPVATRDEREASEAKKISDAFERGVTSTFVDYLVSKGPLAKTARGSSRTVCGKWRRACWTRCAQVDQRKRHRRT